jgi:YHS domain-containing protein
MEKDPVCGMEVADTSDTEQYKYKGKTYYFCTALCKIQFEHDPEKYIIEDDKDDHTKHQH